MYKNVPKMYENVLLNMNMYEYLNMYLVVTTSLFCSLHACAPVKKLLWGSLCKHAKIVIIVMVFCLLCIQ